jgi:hypothetical protein
MLNTPTDPDAWNLLHTYGLALGRFHRPMLNIPTQHRMLPQTMLRQADGL